jgi:predicted nucleotidyltransferase
MGNTITFSKKEKTALKKSGVVAVYLFGSRALGLENPFSDFDFAVLLKDPRSVTADSSEIYDRLYPLFASVIKPKTLDQDVIDIVFIDSPRVPLELKNFIIRNGKLLFDEDPQYRAQTESLIMLMTADFAPYRRMMRDTLLERNTV